MNILYGYRTDEKRKFIVGLGNICECINSDSGFSDDYYVFKTEEERNKFILKSGVKTR